VGFLSSNRNGNDDLFLVETNCSQQTNILVSNSKTGEIIPNADLTVLDENKNIIIYDKTNDKGELSIINDCGKVYSIIVSKQGFEKKSTNLVTDSKPIRNIDIKIISIDVIITEKEVILKPIYFELRKWNITSQGSEELDKLVNVMMENPEMKIFIKSHTDNRDTDKNNLLLSEKRAKSTVDYIISQGIDSNRISGKGCGESELKINCTNCTEDEHSQNRRSEFLIIK
jgi:outer membrane protein OmpA-like peptidoglycan-associated protein